MGSYYARLAGTRICDSSRAVLAADDTDYSGIRKNETFIYAVQIGYNGKDSVASTYQLMFRKVGDAEFVNVTDTTAVCYVTSGTLVDGTLITGPEGSGTARCTAQAGETWDGTEGMEVESRSLTGSINLGSDCYGEFQVALGFDPTLGLEGTQYEFQVWGVAANLALSMDNDGAYAKITTASDQPSVVLNTADETAFGADTTPTLEFTGTDASGSPVRYNIQIDTVDTFDSQADTVIASYSESNYDANMSLSGDGGDYGGQSFSGDGLDITSCKFYILRGADWEGSLQAELYDHSGVMGTSSLPTGSALATSTAKTQADVGESFGLVEFTFGTPYTTVAGSNYVITLKVTRSAGTSNISFGSDTSSSTHPGNACYNTGVGWNAYDTRDLCFYVISDTNGPLINKTSGSDAGFAGTPDNTDPFASAQLVSYTVQVGEELVTDTYYWRVRGMDPAPGSGVYGAFTASKWFTIATVHDIAGLDFFGAV